MRSSQLEIDVRYHPIPGIYGYRQQDQADNEPCAKVRGLVLGVPGRSTAEGKLVAWDSAERPLDLYTRGCEIVVESAATESCPLRLQTYWQIVEERVVDLQVLLASDQPVARAEVHTVTRLAAGQVLTPIVNSEHGKQRFEDLAHRLPPEAKHLTFTRSSAAGGRLALKEPKRDAGPVSLEAPLLVFRLTDGKTSYVEMAHAEDAARLDCIWHGEHEDGAGRGEIETRFQLFRAPLEKGVILRTRLRAHLIPRKHDLQQARRLYEQFMAEPPPLAV